MADSRILQLLRNSSPLESKTVALEKINNILTGQTSVIEDGTPFICRYTDTDKVKTLFAIAYKQGDASGHTLTVFDSDGIDESKVTSLITAEINKLNKSDSEVSGEYVASVSESKGIITVQRKKLLADADKVLSIDNGSIKSTISLKKITKGLGGNEKEKFQLVGIDGSTPLGDAITIYKDQTFTGAEIISGGTEDVDEDTLRLKYTDASGAEQHVDIPLGSFLRESEFKDGLKVSGGTVSVNVSASGSTDNFLVYEGEEEGSKTLAVREMKTNVTKTSKKIPVAGGPLANLVQEVYPDGIDEGTDMQTILMNLLCKELFPDGSVAQGKLASAFAQPSVIVPNNGQTVEVGTSITVPQWNAYEPTSSSTARTYSNFTYGWSSSDDNTKDSDNNPPSVNVTGITLNSGTYKLTRTYSGFGKNTGNQTTTASGETVGEVNIPADSSLVVEEGENKVTFQIEGPGHNGKVDASPEYYIISNLGNTNSVKKVANQELQTLNIATATTSSRAYTVTGAFKYFLGYSTNTEYSQFDSSAIRALTVKTGNLSKDSTTTVVNVTPLKSNGQSIIIACPSKYELKQIQNGLGADILANFSSKGTVKVNTGSIQTDYMVYVYPITNGAIVEYKNVTIGKV